MLPVELGAPISSVADYRLQLPKKNLIRCLELVDHYILSKMWQANRPTVAWLGGKGSVLQRASSISLRSWSPLSVMRSR